ncbi:putative CtpA-like serine protease [Clostridium tepidiprofundi DSM 19306]|uniref:Putative CtpA-like serine protease n=1 Tax=Clostridium tepidiprofundi DSM 19306 TaxID=1121338 RepID=A0A151B476_9CLOT|nr:S41 family peptidase [Clostridium tepidiprofundi]KYH34724.1 putative CtpA-like serine protease [Clostridium tepidiprofundi DSM 19306]
MKSRYIGGKKLGGIIAFFTFIIINLNFTNIFAIEGSTTKEIVLNQVRSSIEYYYYKDVPDKILNLNTPEEIVNALNEPYTKYMSKEEYDDFINSIDMNICGIGVYVGVDEKGVLVKETIKGSPAEEAGIKSGDIILKANDNLLTGMKLDDAVKYIKGKEGTNVKLLVKRENENLYFNVERRKIKIPSAEGKVIDKHIGYIVIHSFSTDTNKYFSDILKKFRTQNIDSYIIDLRNNGGGYMSTARRIAGHFIGNNTCLIVKDRKGKEQKLTAIAQNEIIDKPTIFLINQYSASASEILSSAVKDYEKAYFIGTKTFGKGVAQIMFGLYDGSAIKITTEEFFSPLGNKINNIGVKPDLMIDGADSLKAAKTLLNSLCIYDYKKIKTFYDVPLNKKFTIVFSKSIDCNNIIDDSIELIEASSGKKVAFDIKKSGKYNIMLIPKHELLKNSCYILIINDSIEEGNGEKLKEGIISVINTKTN